MDGGNVITKGDTENENEEKTKEKRSERQEGTFEKPGIVITRLDVNKYDNPNDTRNVVYEKKDLINSEKNDWSAEKKDTSAEKKDTSPERSITDDIDGDDSKSTEFNESPLSEEEEKKLKRRILTIFIVLNFLGFLGSFSYWMQSGVLPYLTRKLGVYSEVFGYMQSTYAFYQMIGSPIFGRCGDVFGCRCVMIISEFASMLSYGSLSFASNVAMLFLSRVPAFAMHNLQGSYMIITDITLPKDRAKMLGILGVSHGLGMIVGSIVGGVITEAVGEESTPLVAASGNLIAIGLVIFFIPGDTKVIRRQLSNIKERNTVSRETISIATLTGFKEILSVLNIKNIKYLLFVKITSAFPFTLVYSFFSMAIMDYFHLGPKINGIILAYIGGLVIVIQGGLIGILTKYFADPVIIKFSIFINTGAFLFLIIADNLYLLCMVFLPLVIGGTVSHIVITAAITKIVPIGDTGSALGLTLALHALIRSVAPTVGGLIFNYIGWPFFGVVGYSMSLFLSVFMVLIANNDF